MAARGATRLPSSPWRWHRARRPDPLPALLAAAAAVVYALHGFGGALSRDLGVYAYAGLTVADGVPPYVGIFNRAGPLAHLIPAVGVLGARTVGGDEVLGMRVLFLLIAVASVAVAYLLARDTFGSRLAGAAGAVTLTAFPAVITLSSTGPREKTPMVLFMLLALWAVVLRRFVLAGLFVAAATLTLQIAFFTLFPAVVVAALGQPDRRSRVRALLGVGAAGAVSLCVTAGCFAAVGRLPEFLDGFVIVNARYSGNTSALTHLGEVWRTMVDGYGVLLPVFLGGLLVLPVLARVLLRSRPHDGPPPAVVTAVAAGALGGVVWSLRDFDRWPDSYPLLPCVVVGVAGAMWLVERRAGRQAARVVATACTVLALVVGTSYSVARREDELQAQRDSVAAVLSVLPGARIASIEAPQVLVLADRRNPTPYQMMSWPMRRFIRDHWDGGFRGFVGRLRDRAHGLVAVRDGLAHHWAVLLAPRYTPVGGAAGVQWLVARKLGPAVRHRLHEALLAVRQRSSPGS